MAASSGVIGMLDGPRYDSKFQPGKGDMTGNHTPQKGDLKWMVAPSSRGDVAVGAGRRAPARLIMLRPRVSARVLRATDAPGSLLVFSGSWYYFAFTSPI